MKSILRFAALIIGVTIVALAILYGMDYLEYRKSPEYQALKQYEELKEQYENDPYGGSTPEETLQLFIEALRKEDTELASKYFVFEKQEIWKKDLDSLRSRNFLGETINDLEKMKLTQKNEDTAFYTLVDVDSIAISEIIIIKSPNTKWKISQL